MNVVIEGPDGGGKSTLARYLAHELDLRLVLGGGPPRSMEEINERMRSYLAMADCVFDRHPCVSQPIYGELRGREAGLDETLVSSLYATDDVIVYCRPESAEAALRAHVVKPGESDDHIRRINEDYPRLLSMYDAWALRRASLIYRIGEDREALLDVLRVLAC